MWPNRCNNNNFIDLWISSTCFGQSFAHLQERKTVFTAMWCDVLIFVDRLLPGVGWDCLQSHLTPGSKRSTQIRTSHHIAVNTVLRSWRWAKDCPKHVELIQRSIRLLLLHLVGHLYYSPTLMMHGQTQIKKSWLRLFSRLPFTYIFPSTFPSVTVPTQDVTNPVSLPYMYCL